MVFAVATFLLAGCGQSVSENETEVKNKIQLDISTEDVSQNTTEGVEIIEGSPAEKTGIYNQKAIEVQNQLEFLLEQDPRSSFLDKIILTAFAEDATDEEVEDLLVELQTYLELATEAATESTDPAEIAELLVDVQTTQSATIDLFEGVDSTELVEELIEEIESSGDEISVAVKEVEGAVDAGLFEIEIDIETDVEDFIASGVRRIDLREKRNPIRRAARKIQSAQIEYQKVKTKLIKNGIDEIVAGEMLAESRERITTAEVKIGEGEFRAAVSLATEGKVLSKRIKNVSEVVGRARGQYQNLQIAAGAGDEAAIEKSEKLQLLVDEKKELKALIEERVRLRRDFVEEAKSVRVEIQKVRRDDRVEFRELKQQQISGEIDEEEFEAQKKKLIESVKLKKEETKESRAELKTERENVRGEIQQKIKTQKEEVKNAQVGLQVDEGEIDDDSGGSENGDLR